MRHSPGFTKIELLMVVAVILILACFALPSHRADRARAVDAEIASTVRNVALGEEWFFASNRAYAGDVRELGGVVRDGVDVTIEPGNTGDLRSSFRLIATHAEATSTYTWTSDPSTGEPNLLVTPAGFGGVAGDD
jgi:prepilin-type N-terminal cleavage/methylation domain-containing protein